MLIAKEIMAKKVVSVKADLPVEKLAGVLWSIRIKWAPVVDDDGQLMGW